MYIIRHPADHPPGAHTNGPQRASPRASPTSPADAPLTYLPCNLPTPNPRPADEDKAISDWRGCNDGSFQFKPRQGDIIVFYDTLPDGTIDKHTLHGSCPVVRGTKWSMAKWLHGRPISGVY